MAIGTVFTLGFNGQAVKRGLDMLKADVKIFGKSSGSISGAFKNIGSNLTKYVSGGLANLASKIATLFTIAIPAAIGAGVYSLGKSASDSASELENLIAQYEIFTGSAEKAKEMVAEMRKIAVESPLELKDISEAARLLLAMGVSQEKVAKTTEMLSEISAGNGEVMGRLAYAFGQISSLGRLTGTELRQLTETGFNPLEFIMKRTGETMEQVRKRMEDGKVSVNEVEMAMDAATSAGGRFYGLNEKMSQTFSGRVSMMKDQWNQLTASLGDGLNSGLKVAVDAITKKLPEFTAAFSKVGKSIGDAIADAVAGDMDKLTAIGDLIGSTIAAVATAAFQKASAEIFSRGLQGSLRGFLGNLTYGVPSGMVDKVQGMIPRANTPSFSDLIDSQMINNGIQGKLDAVMGNRTGGAYQPTKASPNYFDSPQGRMDAEFTRKHYQRVEQLLEEQLKAGSTL